MSIYLKLKMYFVLAAIMVVFYAMSLHATNNSTPIVWKVISSSTSELILSYKSIVSGYDSIYTEDGRLTILPKIESASVECSESGSPVRLTAKQNICIPSPEGFEITALQIVSIKSIPALMTPSPGFQRAGEQAEPIYKIDNSLYNQGNNKNWVVLNYTGIARDRYIATLTIDAARYNPETNSIEIPTQVIVKIKFKEQPAINGSILTQNYDNDIPSSINHYETKNWTINQVHLANYNKEKKNVLQGSVPNDWVKIAIESEGLYKIDADMLSGIGVSIPKEAISTIKIYGNGGEALSDKIPDALKNNMNEREIIVNTKSNGDLSSIIFYGSPANGFAYDSSKGFRHYINHFSEKNYFLLTWGGSEGKRAQPIPAPEGNIVNKPLTYIQRIFFEEEFVNAFIDKSGQVWFGGNIFPRTFTNLLPNLDRTGNIFYRFSMAHRAEETGYFTITEDGREISKLWLKGIAIGNYDDAYNKVETVSIPASQIASDNRSVLKYTYTNDLAGTNSTTLFDWYEIHYPRSFVPIDNQISFFSDPTMSGITEYSINNFSGQDIYGFDITELSNPKMLKNLSSIGGMFIFRTDLKEKQPGRFFIASQTKKPSIEKTEFGYLRTELEPADVIFITHPDLINSANKYKEYRESQGELTVDIVRTDFIYNEFASGVTDPTAIRDFLAYVYNKWGTKPSYVIFWGDGHYDYKNIESKTKNYVPPYESKDEVDTFYAINSFTSDDYFARIVGDDGLIDIAIGRLPVDSPTRGEWLVDKIKTYENSSSLDSWRTQITLLADDSPKNKGGDGDTHTQDSEDLARNILPGDILQKKIYLPEYPTENITGGRRKPRVMEDMVTTVNTTGSLILNWVGHGNPRVLAHEEIFERSITVPLMTNINKLFFMTAATCDFSRFDMPDIKSGAEELVLSGRGGAIAVFSSTRVVWASQNAALNNLFYTKLFQRNTVTGKYPRLGDVVFATKQERTDINDQKFYLLGDPTIRIHIPDYYVKIDSINGIWIGDGGDTCKLQALSNVRIAGRIYKFNNSDEQATDFNGTAILTMLDSDEEIQVRDIDDTIHHILKWGGSLNRSSYPVINGKFTANFIIPKDISFSNDIGRIFAYAYSNDNRFAKGTTRKFILGGVDTTQISDGIGPDISLYLDARTFLPGDIVKPIPLLIVDLKDGSGINTTGLGIGHRIEAWIDDSPTAIDLTNKFTTSLEDSRAGTVEELLFNLNPGQHTVKVRAWDVFNNYSVAETYFRIAKAGEGIIISKLFSYPNPSTGVATFVFQHNISPPFTADINIYNMLGQKIRTISENLTTAHTSEIFWDGLDENGNSLPSGTYIYRLLLNSATSNSRIETAGLTIIK